MSAAPSMPIAGVACRRCHRPRATVEVHTQKDQKQLPLARYCNCGQDYDDDDEDIDQRLIERMALSAVDSETLTALR